MATVATPRGTVGPSRPAPGSGRLGIAAALLLLVGGSLFLRTRTLDASFWIDEGLSVGIASHPFLEIPSVLLKDGSPPLYYLMLNLWMQAFGPSEAATHALSLAFGLLIIPVGLWAGWSLFGRRAGLYCAALCALNPFLTAYAQETRMYALMAFLSLIATAAFLHVFVYRRRSYLPLLVGALTLMLYTHNWALFFMVGAVLALVPCLRRTAARRAVLVDALIAFGAAGLLFVPWLPTLVFQALHTGAPWGNPPSLFALLIRAPGALTAGPTAGVALLLGAGAGIAATLARRFAAERAAVLAMIVIPSVTLLVAWGFSQVSPAWAHRYLAVLLGPLLLLFGLGFARAGRQGLAAFALVAIFWGIQLPFDDKSNAEGVMRSAGMEMRPGDLVISTHPEQVPVLSYYLPPGLRYADPLGPVPDPRVMDWRDALPRLQRATPETTLAPELAEVPTGGRVLLVRPIIGEGIEWDAPWTELVRERSAEWSSALARDRSFKRVAVIPRLYPQTLPRGVRAVLYEKRSQS